MKEQKYEKYLALVSNKQTYMHTHAYTLTHTHTHHMYNKLTTDINQYIQPCTCNITSPLFPQVPV